MKKAFLFWFILLTNPSLYAQDYPQWPADKPETGFIEESQSREIRLKNDILPQEIDMQDKMRVIITDMMEDASDNLGWPMVELSEYTNEGALQNGGTPYPIRSPRGIDITFQFIINKDSLQAWKSYQSDYAKTRLNSQEANYDNAQSLMESPKYKQYQDSANYYMNLYTTYTTAHQDEGAALFTKDKHPKYYQQKEKEFINKMTDMTQKIHDNSGTEQQEDNWEEQTFRFRNHTTLQVSFRINNFTAEAIDQSLGPIESIPKLYPESGAKVSKMYAIPRNQENKKLVKWNNVLLILLGNFQTKPDQYGYYQAGFNLNGQGDEHTPKKIKSDKVQNISINISGNKSNVEKMVKLIDVEKLNSTIVKN
ncbi:MAG TPA: hypothetical protein VFI29_11255 [Hanamia sp.]|nr:hypothetical protein [Hanamia sp.]